MEISDLLLCRTSDHPLLSERIKTLSRTLKWYSRNVSRTSSLLSLEASATDTEVLSLLVDTLRECPRQPTLEYPDYKACIVLLASCPEGFAHYYLYDLASWHIGSEQIDELVYFSEVLFYLGNHSYLNGVYNCVAGFFFNARRQDFRTGRTDITEAQFQQAEKNFNLVQRTFKEEVYIKYKKSRNHRELAQNCGMEYTSFCRKFKKEFGQTFASWMRERRCDKIIYLLVFTEYPLIEISRIMKFPAQHNFNDFCTKYLNDSPGNLREKLRKQPNGIFRRKKEVIAKNEE